MSEMSDADVFSALTDAAAADVAAESGEQAEVPQASPEAPEQGAPVEEQPEPVDQAPEAPEAPEGEQSDPEPDMPFNPDELPEELVPAWRQMQAAFTPRLQEAAAIRKEFEELGGRENIQQAMDFYDRISDPQQWPTLYEELYGAMQRAGFEFEGDEPATPAQPSPYSGLADDPELAPLVSELESLRRGSEEQHMLLEQMRAEAAQRQAMAEEELRQTQYLAQMQRQVTAIRNANPHYDDDDVRAIVELGSFYGDDLVQAQQRYEAIVSRRLDRYFASKKAGAPAAVTPPAGAGVLSETDKDPETLEDAAEQAVEHLRRLQAEGLLDT